MGCSDQIVALGPVSSTGQYEYVILSNWVKYPVVGMIRDLRTYGPAYERMNAWLRQNGYMNVLTDTFGKCRTCHTSITPFVYRFIHLA
jgi:hypothetical protein